MARKFGSNWPDNLFLIIGGLLGAAMTISTVGTRAMFSEPFFFFAMLLLASLGALFGSISGVFFGGMIIGGVVFKIIERLNGGPFKVGDAVNVYGGPFDGQTAVIYELWEARGQVRVDAGPQAKFDVSDVVNVVQIRKAL